MMQPSTIPLTWAALLDHVRRPWLDSHRGEMPARPGAIALDAPVAIAACAQFSQRHAFATEAEAETYRWVGPRAQNVRLYDHIARSAREQVRVMVGCVRYWRARNAVQADLDRAELRERWWVYRAAQHRLVDQIDYVRDTLTPRNAPVVTIPMHVAAE